VPQRNPEETQRRLLETAEREFARHGFAGARVARVARAAGANQRMVYHYFVSKQGMYEAVLRHVAEELDNQMLPVFTAHADRDPVAAYEATMRAYFRIAGRHPTWARLMMQESLDSFRTLNRVTAGPDHRFAPVVLPAIQRAQADGRFRDGLTPLLGFGLAAMLSVMYPLWRPRLVQGAERLNIQVPDQDAAFLDGLLSIVLDGVRPAPAAVTPPPAPQVR